MDNRDILAGFIFIICFGMVMVILLASALVNVSNNEKANAACLESGGIGAVNSNHFESFQCFYERGNFKLIKIFNGRAYVLSLGEDEATL